MLLEFDLNRNDREALLRHRQTFCPATREAREDSRLADALTVIAEALQEGKN